MTNLAEGLATNCCNRLIDGAIREADYLCCFHAYATKFEEEKGQLIAVRNDVKNEIDQEAKHYNKTRVVEEVRRWIDDADAAINEGTITRHKCFYGMCSNCIFEYRLVKKLEKNTLNIAALLERKRQFTRVARPSKNPGIKFYAPPVFIDFESRRPIFKELVAALENENHCMIGLQGLVGMGKTTLAQQVGLHVEQSDSFHDVVFTTVSNSPDINKIRRNIARQLDFQLEGEEERHSEDLWSRIVENDGKVLVILDDIWEKLTLRDIGIPFNQKNCCVLITTRDSDVCEVMRCQRTLSLNTLKDSDVLDIFTKCVGTSTNSTNELKVLAEKIVTGCGGLPLAVAPIATMLQDYDPGKWRIILTPLLNSDPLHNDCGDWIKVGNSLKLSYDRLVSESKGLLLLCSLFPKDYEITMEFLSKLGIGLGLLGEAKNYCRLRDDLISATKKLRKSFLLLENKEACVTMHDFVRKVSLEDKDVQVIMNSSGKLIKSNLKFLSWSDIGFPIHFDGTELKVLLLWIKGKLKVEGSCAIFENMVKLRVLFLHYCHEDVVYPTLSARSFLPLRDIRTLILNVWGLDDITVLKHLHNLVSLEFGNCSIMHIPKEIVEIENLRLLGIRGCKILRMNPFEVIDKCSQLEVLYFVNNEYDIDSKPKDDKENKDEAAHGQSHPALQMYSVACSGLQYFVEDDNGLSKCLNTKHVKNLMSEEMFKYLVGRAEILELWELGEARWKTLIPDIIPMRDAVMQGLTKLCLYHCSDIECLVDNRRRLSTEGVFPDLVELHLVDVNAEDLWLGHMPSRFLSELRVFKLLRCGNLRNNFFHGDLKLPNLKVLQLNDCPMFKASIFQPSVALSLVQLEELSLIGCKEVETLIEYENPREEVMGADNQNSDGFLFPKLKSLKIGGCGKLKLVLSFLLAGDLCLLEDLSIRTCEMLEYIFGEYQAECQVLQKERILPSLATMELDAVPSFINICRACTKCMKKASQTLEHDSNDEQTNSKTCSTCADGFCCLPISSSESMKRNETFHPADRALRQSSSLRNIREMTLMGCSKSESLFCIPIATIVMLEKLKIQGCHKLKFIVSNKREELDGVSGRFIFPELKVIEIKDCDDLQYLFASTISTGIQRLTSIYIDGTPKLEYIFGGYNHEESFPDKNEKKEIPIKLLDLEKLSLISVPQIISICDKNFYLEWPSLKHINLGLCGELIKTPYPHLMVSLQGDQDTMKLLMDMQQLTNLGIRHSEIEEIFNLDGIKRKAKVELKLQVLEIEGLHNLRCIFKDPNNILNLCNLEVLVFNGCDKLRLIFSTSTMKRMPRLSHLEVTQCRELVHVVDDDDDGSRQLRLPKLEKIQISHCHALKSLLSISTFNMLQKLEKLEIEEACNLKEVLDADKMIHNKGGCKM